MQNEHSNGMRRKYLGVHMQKENFAFDMLLTVSNLGVTLISKIFLLKRKRFIETP